MMELVMHTKKNDTMFHTEKTGMLRLVVEINVGGMTTDVIDKVTCSFDGFKLKPVDLKCVHALYELHLQDIRVVPNRHEVDQRESPELFNESYVLYNHVMSTLTAQQERKTRKDYGMKKGRHFTSTSSVFGQPSSSYPNDDDDDDGNDEGISYASTPSPTRLFSSLTNEVPQVFENPPNIDPDMEPFYTRQTDIINHQV
nr:hypothetical protein [Tanacetum cinerariifolium]